MANAITSLFSSLRGKKASLLTDRIATVSLLDRFSTYPSKGLTPERLASLLREADQGDVYRQMELFEEMLEKDGKLFSLFQSRRLRVSRLNYEVIAATEDPKDIEIATAGAEMISRIEGWSNIVNDMLDAVPKGYSVLNLDWQIVDGQWDIVGARQIDPKKFRFGKISDMTSDPEELRLVLDATQIESYRGLVPDSELSVAMTDGISLNADPVFRKRFAVNICKARSGNPARASLLRTCTYLFLFKNFDIKWWIGFAEVLLGYRIGKYDASQEGQKELLEEAVRGLGSDAAAVISKDSEIDFKEMAGKASSHETYKDIKDWANDEYCYVVEGHTGSSQSTPGKLGSEDAAKEATQALIEGDAGSVDATISRDVLRSWTELNYGPQKAYPYYKTHAEPPEDISLLMDVAKKAQDAGYPVGKKYIKELTGIPPVDPKDPDDEVLSPRQVGPSNPFGTPSNVAAKDLREKLLMGR
jgi:phage gp29-like protein